MLKPSDDHPPRSGNDDLTERALAELGDQCQIPLDLEEEILARTLGAQAPVVQITGERPAPLTNLIRLRREEDRRLRRIGWTMAAATVVLLVASALVPPGAPPRSVSALPTSIQMRSEAPGGMHGLEIPESHPRLVEVRKVMFVVAENIARRCQVRSWSTLVRFERSGQATVLEVASSEAEAKPCVEQAISGAHVRPSSGLRLAIRFERTSTSPRDDGAPEARIKGWLVEDT